MVAAIATAVLPFHPVATSAGLFLLGQTISTLGRPRPPQQNPVVGENFGENPKSPSGQEQDKKPSRTVSGFRYYREGELRRVLAALKANSSILVVGEEGSGKSTLGSAVISQLTQEGFAVAFCEPATPKQMLTEIAEQIGVSTHKLEGKSLVVEELKQAIAVHLKSNTAFLIVDDAHSCEPRFRRWLKHLKRQGSPMLVLATNPPRTDIFLNLSRIVLAPLPEYAIRELMEQTALKRGLNLKAHDLARLQQRAGGNPSLAAKTIEEEYLGLDIEAGDHRRYIDGTPLLLLIGVGFVVIRFIGLGTNNQALYVFAGIFAAVFLGVSRLLYYLPGDGRRIKS